MIGHFVLMGFLGGVAHALISAKKWTELKKFPLVRMVILGAITGVVYYYCHSDWGFPNAVMSFVSGYAGVSFIEQLISKFPKLNRS